MVMIEQLRGELQAEREAHQRALVDLRELRMPYEHISTLPGPRVLLPDRTWLMLIDKDRGGLPVCCAIAEALRSIINDFVVNGGDLTLFDEGQQVNVWHAIKAYLATHPSTPPLVQFFEAITRHISLRVRDREAYNSQLGQETHHANTAHGDHVKVELAQVTAGDDADLPTRVDAETVATGPAETGAQQALAL